MKEVTYEELRDIADRLWVQSGAGELTPKQSWNETEYLTPTQIKMARTQSEIRILANMMEDAKEKLKELNMMKNSMEDQ